MMTFQAIISYSHEDKATADAACAKLEAVGTRCWIAPRDIAPGADWNASVLEAIINAQVMIPILAAKTTLSEQVLRGLERAVVNNIPVIPFHTERATLSKTAQRCLGTPHWLDAFDPALESRLARLVVSVNALLTHGHDDGLTVDLGQLYARCVTTMHPPSDSQLSTLLAVAESLGIHQQVGNSLRELTSDTRRKGGEAVRGAGSIKKLLLNKYGPKFAVGFLIGFRLELLANFVSFNKEDTFAHDYIGMIGNQILQAMDEFGVEQEMQDSLSRQIARATDRSRPLPEDDLATLCMLLVFELKNRKNGVPNRTLQSLRSFLTGRVLVGDPTFARAAESALNFQRQ
jgi:hypothetical protein